MNDKKPNARGARGRGSVYFRKGDQRWAGELSRIGIDGRREKKVITSTSRDEVIEKLDDLRKAWAKQPSVRRAGKDTTVGAYIDAWVMSNKSKVAPATWRQREQHVRLHIRPAVGTRLLDRLAVRHVETMLTDIVTAGFTARTAGHVKATLRAALQDAHRDGLVAQNVALLSRSPKPKVTEQKALTATEARTLIERTRGDELGPLWMLALRCGLRAGELCGLSWSDVDVVGQRLHVRAQWTRGHQGYELAALKTEKSRRTIPLTSDSVDVLSAMRDIDKLGGHGADTDAVFHDAAYDRLDPTRLAAQLRAALLAAGLPVVRLHDLRHTAASIWIGAGVDIKTVADLLGHSTPITTLNIYAHTDERRKQDAVEQMSRALSDGAKAGLTDAEVL